jgi:hypothetical protein
MRQVEWTELRMGETFLVDGNKAPNRWLFHERSAWEVRWYPIASSPELVSKAEEQATRNRDDCSKCTKAA